MKKETIEQAWTDIDDTFITEAKNYGAKTKKKVSVFRKLSYVAAAIIGVIILSLGSVTVAAAAGIPQAYDLIYAFNPSLALKLVPVNTSCDSNDIRMNVDSVYIHDDTAEICVSMQDLKEQRIDETIDLFDSYDIGTPNDSIGTCSFVSFDEATQKAYFLVTVQHMHGKPIQSGNMSFSIREFLTNKQETKRTLEEIKLSTLEEVTHVTTDVTIRGGNRDDSTVFLCKNEEQSFSLTEGVTVCAYGLIDGRLHVQIHYEDILNTDNHGFISLTDGSNERLLPESNVAFWDEDHTGSYEEYIFAPLGDNLKNMQVYGEFTTCAGKVTGDWKVTFPIQNTQ